MLGSLLKSEKIVVAMLVMSLVLYGIEYLFFGQAREIGFGFLGNLAFLPIYVLFVTLMIERVLKQRERDALRQKLNMVIGVFFSEVGTPLLRDGFGFVQDCGGLAERLMVSGLWKDADFTAALDFLKGHEVSINSRNGNLSALRSFLVARRQFMLGLLENPNLLEHDDFTELLWAVFHLLEELEARRDFSSLPETDLDHLSGDIKRAYMHLLHQWVIYMRHLKNDYPYLFSLAVRTNPLNPSARVEVG
jgi:branched-subunit amino acid transport protein